MSAGFPVIFVALSCSDRGHPVAAAETTRAWFTEITDESGLDSVHSSGARGEYRLPEIMGGGVALLDAEEDGDLDVYCVNGAGSSRFYRCGASGRLADDTEASGLADGRYGMGPAVGDVDNDGDEDVYVTHFGPNALFVNDGEGRFADAGAHSGASGDGWSTSAAFFDLDRDGLLDLYVVRYVTYDESRTCYDNAGQRDYCGPRVFPPVHDLLFRNTGAGVFRDATHAAGIDSVAAAGMGVVCADLDEDGWQDVYVANDAYANQLWISGKDGTFRDRALQLGVALGLNGQPRAGMGVTIADLNDDTRLDLFVTHLREEANGLFLNQGERGFRDDAGPSGMGPSSMPFTGFGTAALDFDRDGDADVIVANGAVVHGKRFPGVALPAPWDTYAEPNLFYVNEGNGRFRQADELGGTLTSRVEISRGLACGDVDDDGDPDVLVGQIEGPARLYRNDAPSGAPERHWLSVRCVHPGWKRDALGARVEIAACGRRQVQVLSSSWSYLSSSPPRAWFGLGPCERVDQVDVRWPDGRRERFADPGIDRAVVLVYGAGGE